jgi:hypothetical protein
MNVVMGSSSDIGRGAATWLQELHVPDAPADQYSCPVCGIELSRSNFDTPARDYYCPFCSTRQTPTVVRAE